MARLQVELIKFIKDCERGGQSIFQALLYGFVKKYKTKLIIEEALEEFVNELDEPKKLQAFKQNPSPFIEKYIYGSGVEIIRKKGMKFWQKFDENGIKLRDDYLIQCTTYFQKILEQYRLLEQMLTKSEFGKEIGDYIDCVAHMDKTTFTRHLYPNVMRLQFETLLHELPELKIKPGDDWARKIDEGLVDVILTMIARMRDK